MFILTPILFQEFSLELLNNLNAQGSCNGVYLFFFSKPDRMIAPRAPKDSYLYDYIDEIYNAVKGYYTNAIDRPDSHTFAHALNMTLLTMYNCMKKEEGMCLDSDYELIVYIIVYILLAYFIFPFAFSFGVLICVILRNCIRGDCSGRIVGGMGGRGGDGGCGGEFRFLDLD